MFGSRPRPVRPFLLLIVYGLFLVIVGVTAAAQTAMVSLHFATATMNTVVGGDAAVVRTFVNGYLRPADLAGAAGPDRTVAVERGLDRLLENDGLVRIEVRDADGVVRFANDGVGRGTTSPRTEAFVTALRGVVQPDFVATDVSEAAAGLTPPQLLREYFPLLDERGTIQGVVAMWRDAGPILAALDGVRTQVVVITLSAALIAAVLLSLIFRASQRRISRQTAQLVESTRRDALTGLLNHGSLVGELALAIEAARGESSAIAVALLDLDNFRLLNDTYGHESGDVALRLLAGELERTVPRDAIVGRYGPDEFLVIAPASRIADLEPMVETIRHRLVDEMLQFDATERLPITVSAGIAAFPDDATSVTDLLSTVATVLNEAKAGGGDAIRVAGRTPETTAETRTFDVLQGLVFAVDTKDRYTKRHSEDVARYAVFLARRLGLDEGFLRTITTAGLLHDVGKIGIPDAVLRKPGKLTEDEYEIVKQHVALGDAIVRNLANVEHVRAGIRHHHERWDGHGYLHGLAGEEIPLIARILAVGDAFSAMTTTRPYRKALPVEEALRRLGDAAGTQLDESLVTAFIRGIEEAADAPIPGTESPTPLWVPAGRVA